jgi:hypothetical protein
MVEYDLDAKQAMERFRNAMLEDKDKLEVNPVD